MTSLMKLFGLIGYPLSHSYSEKHFSEKFSREGITDAVYRKFSLKRISDLHRLIESNPDLLGLNVTIPYKEAVLPYIDMIDPVAEKTGAVNTIKITRNTPAAAVNKPYILCGYNTDVDGFKMSIRSLLQEYHQKALILGTGGAAKAVAYALGNLDVEHLFVSREADAKSNAVGYNKLDEKIIRSHLLIINATPVGMYPGHDKYPALPYNHLTEKHLLYDLIYNPEETEFLKRGKAQGAAIKNGQEMLELQAGRSWDIWIGK